MPPVAYLRPITRPVPAGPRRTHCRGRCLTEDLCLMQPSAWTTLSSGVCSTVSNATSSSQTKTPLLRLRARATSRPCALRPQCVLAWMSYSSLMRVWEASDPGDATRVLGRRAPALPLAVVSLAVVSLAITRAVDSDTCEGDVTRRCCRIRASRVHCRAALGIRGRVPNAPWDAGGPPCMHACDTARNNERGGERGVRPAGVRCRAAWAHGNLLAVCMVRRNVPVISLVMARVVENDAYGGGALATRIVNVAGVPAPVGCAVERRGGSGNVVPWDAVRPATRLMLLTLGRAAEDGRLSMIFRCFRARERCCVYASEDLPCAPPQLRPRGGAGTLERATSVLTDGEAWHLDAVLGEVRTSVEKAPESAPLRISVLGIGDVRGHCTRGVRGVHPRRRARDELHGEDRAPVEGLQDTRHLEYLRRLGRPSAKVATVPESEDDFEMVGEVAGTQKGKTLNVFDESVDPMHVDETQAPPPPPP
ncbi:hypothetical protein B0H14DRAFT_3131380 [Mycena olivaceomarginata]|nr:hypothetical protein B0H14DRAFT_3131380 [Mycena olivaceomarginata]